MQSVQLTIRNKSNYFVPDKDKTEITVLNPKSHRFRISKQYGYYQRLFYEFEYCNSCNGQVFFYTLTYSDRNVPFYEGQPCFDYNDLRSFVNGAFKKYITRYYHCQLKYFISAELGEGAGSRGYENNPHYHCLFFLTPIPGKESSYIKIKPTEFCHWVKYYWQGFDESVSWTDYREAKYGIAYPGENLGLVSDFRAVSYVVKYVTKDVGLVRREGFLKKVIFERYLQQVYDSEEYRLEFLHKVLLPKYSVFDYVDLPDPEAPCKNLSDIVSKYVEGFEEVEVTEEDFLRSFNFFLDTLSFELDYNDFCISVAEEFTRIELNNYRNRFCNKCRVSQGVGEYALNFIDKRDPLVRVPTKNGIEYKKICLYYYRKLYCYTVKDPYGIPLYVLNKDGIDFKVSRLPFNHNFLVNKVKSYRIMLDRTLFQDLQKEGSIPGFWSFDEFLELLNIDFNIDLYADYKLVYEGRYYSLIKSSEGFEYSQPSLDVVGDYRRFLSPSFYETDYLRNGATVFLQDDNKTLLPYCSHPVFCQLVSFFSMLDNLSVYFAQNKDNRQREIYEENKRIKKLFDKLRVKQYYSSFKF